jgi:predicted nucleic acid-binding Zn ribbon protein
MEQISSTLLSLYSGMPQHGEWVTACLQGAWNGLVGEKVAGICRPVSIRQAELVIEVLDDAWMPALASMKRELLERIQSYAGREIRRLALIARSF